MMALKRVFLVLCTGLVLAGCSGKSQEEQHKIAQAEKEQREAREKIQEKQKSQKEQAALTEEPAPEDIKGEQKITCRTKSS